MVYGLIVGLAAGIDQALKWWIEKQEPEDFPRPLKKAGGKILLYRNHNAGFPFGFLKEYGELVRMVPLVVTSMLAGVLCYLAGKKGKAVQKTALAAVIGGSASNLYDRFVRRYVVDYFSFQFGFLKKVVFNLGDICVFAGSGLLLILELVRQTRAGAEKAAESAKIVIDRTSEML